MVAHWQKDPVVNANHSPPAGNPLPEAALERMKRAMEETAGLLQGQFTPAEFHAEFLPRVLTALEGIAGAVWSRTAEGEFRLEHQINLPAIGLDRIPGAAACHGELLRRVARGDRPHWAGPRGAQDAKPERPVAANLGTHAVLLAPILIDRTAAGVVEVWLDPATGAALRKALARFLAEVAGFAAAFLHKEQWRQLQEQQQLWGRCETFARQVHGSLDPRAVAYLIANQARSLVGCDQVAVAARAGARVHVEAVSGAVTPEPRGPLLRSMRELCERVLHWGEKLVYAGTREETLPPPVLQALDAYLRESNSRALVVLPLRDEREQAQPGPGRAALLAECFEPSLGPEQLEARLQVVVQHATPALYNALEYRRAAAGWLKRCQSGLLDWARGRRGRKGLVLLVVLMALVGTLLLVPAPLRLDARGQLLPKERQFVYAELHGKVVEVKAQHGEQVHRGQELLFLRDLETQLKIEQLGIKVSFAEQRLTVLGDQLARAVGEERSALVRERINQEYELRKSAAERYILLQGSANPRKAPVTAPISGKLVTFDPHEQLSGKAVKPGDPLLRVARVQGAWEVELLIPEGHLAPIREGLQRSADGTLEVRLLLTSQPLKDYRGTLRRNGLGGETILKDNVAVLPARVEITDPELVTQLSRMPVGLEVRARIHCGNRALGYVWFSDLIEFLYEHLLF
jgi:biotin carboxyl carrier protein